MKKILIVMFAFSFLFPVMAAEDVHFIQPDDYFISDSALGDHAWIPVHLAKMINANSPKGDAQFMRVKDGKKLWTKNFYTTRIAQKSDLKLGVKMIALDTSEDGIYRAPKTKQEARTVPWFLAVITDTSDLYKDYVTVSGGYKVNINAMRILIKDNSEAEVIPDSIEESQ